ncbi:homocysteine S-methyltransferase family protein [Elusimicrobiota bacterium]
MKKKSGEIVFLDGAMGTNLDKRGVCSTPISNLKDPGAVKDILKGFIEAGSNIIETNTFSATEARFKDYRKINRLGVRIARQAVEESGKKRVKIAGCVGPTGKMVKPVGSLDFEEAVGIFKSQIKILSDEKVDLLIIETMDDISEMRAALIAAKETAPSLNIIATMTFSEGNYTSTGTPPEVAAAVMDSLGASVLGVNCSFGPEGLIEVVKRMRRVTAKPIAVQANAGIPVLKDGKTIHPYGPREYAGLVKKLVKEGAGYIGGCCGTTQEHIRYLVKELKDLKPGSTPGDIPLMITSRSRWTEFGEFPVIIGERINLIAHPELKQGNSKIINEGLRQMNAGAQALDVNLGRDEEKTWEVVELISRKVDLPVVLDSQSSVQVEKVARRYPGVMLLNSISGEKKKLDKLLPLAKKYGFPFVGLCLDDKGVPKTVQGKLRVCRNIFKRARAIKINPDHIVVDPLTLAVSADIDSAKNTLKAVSEMKNNTILGVSNVSSGLPQRAVLNQIFSAMAVQSGCSALIVNPLDADLIYSIHASALLSARDKKAVNYLRYFSPQEAAFTFKNALSQSILEGDKEKAVKETRKLVNSSMSDLKIINKYIVPALDKVGENFSNRRVFLPQLIESAKVARIAMEMIQKKIVSRGEVVKSKGKILIATVKDDIHDIGKNLVTMMLKNHSYDVEDMGVDVDPEKIVIEAKKWGADIIALSSLMTTTINNMGAVMKSLKKRKVNIPVLIGGAAVTAKYAESIGAHYAKDAVEAVKAAGVLLEK